MIIEFTSANDIKNALSIASEYISSVKLNLPDNFDISDLYIDKIRSDVWPVAVDPLLIAMDTDEDKKVRGELILELVVEESLVGKKVLDFGCGNGYVAEEAAKTASLSIGYDIVEDPDWTKHTKSINTTDKTIVEKNAPYNIIILYDVLDHLPANTQAETLKYIKSLCTDRGKIFVRCHGWFAKNGTHMFKSLNKAFVQFFLSDAAIAKYGYKQETVTKNLLPNYPQLFAESGLKIISDKVYREPIDPFFMLPEQLSVIMAPYRAKYNNVMPPPIKTLSSVFGDYTLVKG